MLVLTDDHVFFEKSDDYVGVCVSHATCACSGAFFDLAHELVVLSSLKS